MIFYSVKKTKSDDFRELGGRKTLHYSKKAKTPPLGLRLKKRERGLSPWEHVSGSLGAARYMR